jgi:hypothetical protein
MVFCPPSPFGYSLQRETKMHSPKLSSLGGGGTVGDGGGHRSKSHLRRGGVDKTSYPLLTKLGKCATVFAYRPMQ